MTPARDPSTPSAPQAVQAPGAFAWIERVGHVTRVLARHAAGAVFAKSSMSGAMRFRVLIEDLGGSFVKFGQVLAVQPDLLPPGYATQLLDLLDRVAPVPTEIVRQTLAAELGPAAARLRSMNPEPLATASIAQVHVAQLEPSSASEQPMTVAVKVQRP